MRKIKLIWDFRGTDGHQTALHHEIHLKDFAVREKLEETISGTVAINDSYSIAFIVVREENMLQVRDALVPHRGEIYTAEA